MQLINFKEIEAIIFDFDGVIFDTEPLWFKASVNTLKKLEYNFNKKISYRETIGLESEKVFHLMMDHKIDKQKLKKINYIYRKECNKIFQKKLKPFAYLKNFLKKSNFETAIVSNSDYSFINNLLIKSNLKIYFTNKNIISCNKELRPKPKPDGYIKAIKVLNKNSNNIVVIEDSENGITAAKKANISKILRFTNRNLNLNKQIKHKDIQNIQSYKKLSKYFKV